MNADDNASMRAIVVRTFGSPDMALVERMERPAPGPGQALIEVHAAPVNYVDLVIIAGKHQSKPALPMIPGRGAAGIVHALGAGVTNVKVGDRVLAVSGGGYAECMTAPAAQCVCLPNDVSFVDAAAMSMVFDTAWFALRDRARLAPGETVLVLGASGGVGQAAMQLAKAMGARVLAGVSRVETHAAAHAAGAKGIIDLSAPDLRNALRDQVYAFTQGRGVDVILDPLGGDVFDAALRALAWRGRLVVIGFAAGRIATLKTNYLLVKNIEVSGVQLSDYHERNMDEVAACFREVFALRAAGKIKSHRVTTFALEEAQTALRLIESRKAEGRVVLTPR